MFDVVIATSRSLKREIQGRLPDSTGDWPDGKGKREYQKNPAWQLVF